MSAPGITAGVAPSLSPMARACGERVARRLFAARGNRSEAHLSELELALVAATAVDVALTLRANQNAAQIGEEAA